MLFRFSSAVLNFFSGSKVLLFKITVFSQRCLSSKRCSASSLNCINLNLNIKVKLIELAVKLYQEF